MTSLAKIDQFSVIKLTGPDSLSFMQGQVTCDINRLEQEKFVPGCHCNAKGKMWSTFIALKQDEALYLVMSRESAVASLAELKKYGVFAKTEIEDDSENWFIYGADSESSDSISIKLAQQHYLILSRTEKDADAPASNWWQKEILSGRAHLFTNTVSEYVPQMLNLQALDYISFNKGCYMGQEMVARMRYLGKNKRALFIAKSEQPLTLTPGDDMYISLKGNRRSSGKVVNSCVTDGQTYVQLVLPKDTQLTETIYINQDDDTALLLLPLPYSLEQEQG